MSSKTLAATVRVTVVVVFLCGVFLCAYLLPVWGASLARQYPEFGRALWPWLGFLWLCAAPCFAVLVLVWLVSGAIRREAVFTMPVARRIKAGALLLLADAILVFAGNMLFLLLGLSHPGAFAVSLFADIILLALGLLAAVLARFTARAAALQEETEGTV